MVLGSGIRDPEKTYSGSRGQKAPNPGSWIRIRNTEKNHRFTLKALIFCPETSATFVLKLLYLSKVYL
jgi:hypothetical protein